MGSRYPRSVIMGANGAPCGAVAKPSRREGLSSRRQLDRRKYSTRQSIAREKLLTESTLKYLLGSASHFARSSSVQRALGFIQYLSDFGCELVAFSAMQFIYADTSDELLADLSVGLVDATAFNPGAFRNMKLGNWGRYPPSTRRIWRESLLSRRLQG